MSQIASRPLLFGLVPPATEARIHAADVADIERWFDRHFDAARLADA